VRGGRDVEEDHFIRALFIVTERKFDWVTHVAEPARLSASKLHAAGDVSVVDIQAGNDSFRQHGTIVAVSGLGNNLWLERLQSNFESSS